MDRQLDRGGRALGARGVGVARPEQRQPRTDVDVQRLDVDAAPDAPPDHVVTAIGAGRDVRGLTITGVGLGAGGNVTGVQLAGIGIGSGGTLKWVSVAGVGVAAPRIEGVAIAAGVGGEDVRGLVIAPIYFRIANGGRMSGVNVSAFNNVRGTQQGLAIGIFNYARSLDGVQVGILNYAGNKRRGRLLPIVNYARKR